MSSDSSPNSESKSSDSSSGSGSGIDAGVPRQEHEVINPLIQIIRKLNVCNSNQLITWFSNSEFLRIIKTENNMVLLRRMIMKMLCYYSNSLNEIHAFEYLFHLFPNRQYDDIDEPLNLLRLSYPLMKLCFDYFSDRELAQIKQTCKSLNISWEECNESLMTKLCKKIKAMNNEQMIECIKKFIKIFKNKNKMELAKKMLRKSLCFYRSEIALHIFECLLLLAPNENDFDNLNDSITKSDLNDDDDENDKNENEPLTLLQIPKELKIKSFTFLKESDLMTVQKVCRCLCVAARDPNSLHYLDLRAGKNYRHPWYSRIKSLRISPYAQCNPPYVNLKWGKNVTSLYFYMNNKLLHSSLYFDKLLKCHLNRRGSLLFINHINYSTIKILKLWSMQFDKQFLHGIAQCVNLEHLEITPSTVLFDEDAKNLPKINSLDKLKYFKTYTALPSSIFYWILSNTNCRKNISLEHNHSNPIFFSSTHQIKPEIFRSIDEIALKLNNYRHSQPLKLIDDFHKICLNVRNLLFKHLKLSIESEKAKIEMLSSSSFKDLLSHFTSSNLDIDICNEMEDEMKASDADWFEHILQSKMFNDIQICLFMYAIDDAIMDFMVYKSISTNEKDLISESQRIAISLLNVYEIWHSKYSKFQSQAMEFSIRLNSDIDQYVKDSVDDFVGVGPDVPDDVYEAAYEEKLRKIIKIWNETAYPAIIQTVQARISELDSLDRTEMITEANCNGLEIKYKNAEVDDS